VNKRLQRDVSVSLQPQAIGVSGERGLLSRCPGLPGLELLSADFKRHAYAPHWHDAYTIALVPNGCEVVQIKGERRQIARGDVALLNPGEIHDGSAFDAEIGWQFRVFYIDFEALHALDADFGTTHKPGRNFDESVIHDPLLSHQLLRVHHGLSDAQSVLEGSSILFAGLRGLLERTRFRNIPSESASAPPALERARQYLDAHWDQAVTLEELATHAGLSRFHLLREFKKRFGVPPHAYQLQRRIFHAKELLFQGMRPGDVALETGFFDQAHFSHVLKRYVGVSPGRISSGE